jgi:hypothetical protein
MRPKPRRASPTTRPGSSGRSTSAVTARTFAPVARSSAAVRSNDSAFRPHKVTRQPSAARPIAMAFPIPRLEPVTIATLSIRPRSTLLPSTDRTESLRNLLCHV